MRTWNNRCACVQADVVSAGVQTPSRIPENRESCRTLMAEPVALSTNTDTYSPACKHTNTMCLLLLWFVCNISLILSFSRHGFIIYYLQT